MLLKTAYYAFEHCSKIKPIIIMLGIKLYSVEFKLGFLLIFSLIIIYTYVYYHFYFS